METPDWPHPSTQPLEELSSSCGVAALDVGAYRVALEKDSDGGPVAFLRAYVGLESNDLETLNCLLKNSGSGLSLEDFPVGGTYEWEPYRWIDPVGASWSVHGAKASMLAGLTFTYVGIN